MTGFLTRIGKYEVQAELGHGGFGRVYRGFDPTVGRPVAIKVLSSQGDKSLLTRFRNEAAAAGKLRHRNIVTVYEFGEHEGMPFLVMEYLEGRDLQQILSSREPLSLLEKMRIMSQVAEGLHCAHENGVVHRDVKPANIMVLPDGTVKIMDFGIALLVSEDATRLTQQGNLIGTILYMSPEQFTTTEVDALCDVFAYGVIYYELLAGQHPFRAADAAAMMYKITVEDPEPLRSRAPDCPRELEDLVFRALQKDRDLRYQSLREIEIDAEPIRLGLQQERASALLTEAQARLDSGRPDTAQKLLIEALDLDPSNRAARQLREAVQKRIQRATLQPRVDALTSSAAAHAAARRFSDAAQDLEAALRLDRDNPELAERLRLAREALERSRKAARLLADARQHYAGRRFQGCRAAVAEALQIDPENPEAAAMLAKVDAEIAELEREQRIDEGISRATALLAEEQFDSAIALLERLDAESPGVERIARALQRGLDRRAEHDRREEIRKELTAAQNLLRQGRLQEAIGALESLDRRFPGEAGELLSSAREQLEAERKAEARRAGDIAAACAETERLSLGQRHEEALAAIGRALLAFPNEPALVDARDRAVAARAEWQRRQAIIAASGEAAALLRDRNFVEAAARVEAARRHLGSVPELEDLAVRIRAAREEFERQAAAEARERRQREDLERLAAADRALRSQADAPLPEAVIREVRGRHPRDPQIESAALALESHAALLRRARALADGEPEALIDACRRGLEAFPEHSVFRTLMERGEAARRRREQLYLAEVERRLAAEADLDRRIGILEEAVRRFPAEQMLRSELQLTETRRSAVRSLAAEVRALEGAGKYDAAMERAAALRAAWPQYAGPEAETARLERLRDERRAAQRAARVNAVRQAFAGGRWADARAMLAQGFTEFPGDAELRDLEQRIAAGEAVEDQLLQVRRLCSEQRYPEACDALARAYEAAASGGDVRRTVSRAALDELTAAATVDWRGSAQLLDRARAYDAAVNAPRAVQRAISEGLRVERLAMAPVAETVITPVSPAGRAWLTRPRVAAGIGLAALGLAALPLMMRSRNAVPPGATAFEIATDPPGATVRIGERSCSGAGCGFNLPPGSYDVSISKEGYRPVSGRVTVAAGGVTPARFALSPLPNVVRLSTNLRAGEVSLDGRAAGKLAGGELLLEDVPAGDHVLKVTGQGAEATLAFRARPAQAPEVLRAPETRNLSAVAVTGFGGAVRVHCADCTGQSLSADGSPPVPFRNAQADVGRLSAGSHDLRFSGKEDRNILIAVRQEPSLQLYLTSGRDTGTLLVETDQEGAAVSINGKPYNRTVRGGALRIPLDAGAYEVRVEKSGFQAVQPKRVDLRKGAEQRVAFSLLPVPRKFDADRAGSAPARAAASAPEFTPPPAPMIPPPQAGVEPRISSPPVPPKSPEQGDWERLAGSSNPADLAEFVRKYPGGQFAAEALRRMERIEWGAARNGGRAALRAYLQKYPNGSFAAEASGLLARIEEADRANADLAAIQAVLRRYASAWENKDAGQIAALNPGVDGRKVREVFRDVVSLRYALQLTGTPEISGDRAVVTARRSLEQAFQGGKTIPQQATVTFVLRKRNGQWVIDTEQFRP